MADITIEVSDDVLQQARMKLTELGDDSVQQFLAQALEDIADIDTPLDPELEAELLKGLEGEPEPVDDAFWASLDRHIERHRHK